MTSPYPWLAARHLLAVRLDNAGDVVMLGPALRTVKTASPEARITLLASRAGAAAAPLLPWIDDVLVWRALWQDLGHLPFDPARERELVDLLAERGFDGALIFTSFSQTPHVAAYACYLAGIPLRAGESKEFGGAALSHPAPPLPDATHQVARNLHLVGHLGFAGGDAALEIAVPEAGHAAAAARLRDAGIADGIPLAVVHPGASAAARRYPAARFGAVARQLADRGWSVVVTGTEHEQALLDETLLGAGPAVAPVTDLTIAGFAALIDRAGVVVCNNTLPMHLADAVRTSVVALYAGTDLVSQWQPRATPCRILRRETVCTPCYRFDCPIGQPCLDVRPEEVVRAVEEVTGVAKRDIAVAGASPHPSPSQWETGRGEGVRRIAVFQALNLGDFLCATPALRSLRRRFPEAEITLIGRPWAEELVHRLPSVDRFLPFPGWPGIAESPLGDAIAPDWPAFDLAIQMHGAGEVSNGFLASLGARQTLGYGSEGETRLTTALVWREEEAEPLRWLRLVAALGAEPGEPLPDFPVTDAESNRAMTLLPLDGRPWVGLHAGARDEARRWPATAFSRLGDRLAEQYGARIVLTGAAEERPLADDVRGAMRATALDLVGATTLGELAAIVSRLDLLICNDTGISHMAAATRTPSVVLFGPTRPQRWAPRHARHLALDATLAPGAPEDGAAALRALPVALVAAAAGAALDRMAIDNEVGGRRSEVGRTSRSVGQSVSRSVEAVGRTRAIPTQGLSSDLRPPTSDPRPEVAL
jgi:ADP-heptose:LPS heptosyltransferase